MGTAIVQTWNRTCVFWIPDSGCEHGQKNTSVLHLSLSLCLQRWQRELSGIIIDIIIYDLSLNREGRWGTIDDFTTSFLHFTLFSTPLWDLANSRPVHSLMLSSYLFFYLPCLLPPFAVPCVFELWRHPPSDAVLTPAILPITGRLAEGGSVFLPV